MTAATESAEDAVRRYLLFVEDPAQLRDEKEIQKRTQAVLDTTDPLEKLKALAELEQVANIQDEPLRKGFVEHAKAWADATGIPVSAFQELKVPAEVLKEAGFDVAVASRRRSGGVTRQRAKAVPAEDIKAWILNQKGTFLLADIINGAGGSQATVRKTIDELVEAGQVEKLGPVPDYTGRGRAPLQYSHS